MTRDVDAGKPGWERHPAVKRARHYLRRQARVAYLRSRLQRGSSRERALRCLRFATGSDTPSLEAYLKELKDDGGLLSHLADAEDAYRAETALSPGSVHRDAGLLLYALVRALRPATVVETGTANGASSSFLLAALDRNDFGRLVSIDMPFSFKAGNLMPLVPGTDIHTDFASPVPPGREPGWMVPNGLRERWELRLGDARELLPRVLDELDEIELFFHDSLHVREHMLFEFEVAWAHLRLGGVLAADDVFQRRHNALPRFTRSVGARYSTFEGLAFIRKR